ncbi:RagB/SusD family nutrient uptake outer membrane protein [Pedobacter hiemivivus]|uniref:RagB/SusD family nutrient uptake outer membrane protein n=1 Tax=Pedobacter hiemivivus TaxID=2530454 RepID=A0A4V2MKJ3_9SPHI|nr:RagB/SusD family nutrient uptake outer membrane protein [Pedobacter hiemivivus]TCC98426.1 RagB/SusD family nutrient uptake outer membrane protein [Pedobacter hiemivivus]
MKRIILIFAISFFTIITSCKKLLNTVPVDTLSPENYYDTEAQLNSALAGVYDVMGSTKTYGDQLLGGMGLDGDEGFFARNTITDNVRVNQVSAGDPFCADTWRTFYDGINRANMLLDNINKPVMDKAARDAIRGEALFLRAYYHFMLVSNWGDIPLMTKTVYSTSQIYIPRTPAKEVYQQIIADMTQAEGLVNSIDALGYAGRVSQSAVRGILARVCLYMAGNPINDRSQYAEAKKWAQKVMSASGGFQHALNPSYSNVFINMCQDKYDIKESIWEVEFWGNATGVHKEIGRNGSNNGIQYVVTPGDPNYGYSYGFTCITGRLFKRYESLQRDSITPAKTLIKKEYSPDRRRDWSIATYRLVGNPATKSMLGGSQVYERTSAKWRREYEITKPLAKEGGGINFPLLRYSDVLLMFAEAENEINGPTQEAIDAVNQVRRRAYGKYDKGDVVKTIALGNVGSGYTTAPTVTLSGGGGSGATATAIVAGGKVTGIAIVNEGTKYTSAPTVSFSGGAGTGATASTTISSPFDADLTSSQTSNHDSFLEAIQEERSRELTFESLRKRDLVRWNIYLTRMELVAKDFVSGDASNPAAIIPAASSSMAYGIVSFSNLTSRDQLWPISPRELGLNKALKQNEGW